MSDQFPTQKIHSQYAASDAHKLLIRSALIGVGLLLLGLWLNSSILFWILLVVFAVAAIFKASRIINESLEITERHIIVRGLWKTEKIAWGEVEDIHVLVSPLTPEDPEPVDRDEFMRELNNIADTFEDVFIDEHDSLKSIREIALQRRSDFTRPFLITPVSRDSLTALIEAFQWHRDNFARPLNLNIRTADKPDSDSF